MIDEHAFAELHSIAEVTDERREDPDSVQLSSEEFLQISDIGRIIRHSRVGFRAERSCAHHFIHGFPEVGLPVIRRSALIHQLVDIAFFVFHTLYLTEDRLRTATAVPVPSSRKPGCR